MKKSIFLVMAVVLVTTIGCTEKKAELSGPGIHYTQPESQTGVDHFPVTAPRYDCDGNRLPHDKLLRVKSTQYLLPRQTYLITDEYLKCKGYEFTGNYGPCPPENNFGVISDPISDGSNSNHYSPAPVSPVSPGITESKKSPWLESDDWFLDFLKFLFATALLGLVGWGFWWLFTKKPHQTETKDQKPPVNTDSSVQAHQLAVINALKDVGGKTTYEGHGQKFEVAIPQPQKDIIIDVQVFQKEDDKKDIDGEK